MIARPYTRWSRPMPMLLATKDSLLYCIGRLLWRNGSTPGAMKWAKIFIQHFFAAKVFVWFFDEGICERITHRRSICRVRTLWYSPLHCIAEQKPHGYQGVCVQREELEIGFNTFLLHYRHDWGGTPLPKNDFVTPLKIRGPRQTMLKTFDK